MLEFTIFIPNFILETRTKNILLNQESVCTKYEEPGNSSAHGNAIICSASSFFPNNTQYAAIPCRKQRGTCLQGVLTKELCKIADAAAEIFFFICLMRAGRAAFVFAQQKLAQWHQALSHTLKTGKVPPRSPPACGHVRII